MKGATTTTNFERYFLGTLMQLSFEGYSGCVNPKGVEMPIRRNKKK